MKETPVGIAKHACHFRGEGGCVEPLPSFPDVHEVDRLAIVVGNIRSSAAAQRGVVTLAKRHRETSSESSDARNRPAREQFPLESVGCLGEREVIAIAQHKVMS